MPAFLLPFLSGAWNFGKAALAFCAKPPGSYIACAAALALSLWIADEIGYAHGTAAANAANKAAEARAAQAATQANGELQSAIGKLDTKISVDYAAAVTHTVYLTTTIVEKVPAYVTPQTDRAFPLPCGLVRVHDAGILGADPASLAAAGCEADGEPAPATASAFSQNDAEWAGYCHAVEAQRDALKAELLGVTKAWEDYRASLVKAH
ncbi:MAG TPA: hypothetical protein VLW75_10415 [Rhizomicrobium sp.]|nr:hypothetical protein [Rhizomicrobium sp.]